MMTNRRQFLQRAGGLATAAACVPLEPKAWSTDAPLLPTDMRLQPLKDLDGYFPFTPPRSREEWERRAERVRRQMLVALGLWPLPTRTPLNAVIHGRVECEDYTVERAYLESVPGFFVTGSLYRPRQVQGKVPGVLFPHGHWKDGRFMDEGAEVVRREIARGAERFEEGGRSVMQSMCVGLARLGCVVFHYDMIGYADSQQVSFELAHQFKTQRPEMNTTENWGFFSPQAETHLQSILGLQAWNSMRALDFLLGLPEVDPQRIACTGASGGGTQTFILSALDARVKLAFPAVMVSTAMQGGCTCENASLLRVDTGNVEFAGLIAPRPLGMTTANDWTKEMSTKGFPQLKELYTLLGAPDRVALFRGEHFDHNYNGVSRMAFYGWLNKHFALGRPDPVLERDFRRLTREELTVWDSQHPAPPQGPEFEKKLLRGFTEDANRQLAEAARDPASYRKLVGPAVEVVLGRTLSESGRVTWTEVQQKRQRGWREASGQLWNEAHAEAVPLTMAIPAKANRAAVLWIGDSAPAAGLAGPDNGPLLQRFIRAGVSVYSMGLFSPENKTATAGAGGRTRRVANPRESAAYTFGYNHSLFAQRVHDVLTALQYLLQSGTGSTQVFALALEPTAGPVLASSLAVAEQALAAAAIHTHGFRFGQVLDLHDPQFLPGGAKYDDLPGMIALHRTRALWLAGETDAALQWMNRLSSTRIEGPKAGANRPADDAVSWLLNRL